MHGGDSTRAALERAAACAVQASVARAALLAAVAGYVARARVDVGPGPVDRFGLEATEHAEAATSNFVPVAVRAVRHTTPPHLTDPVDIG